jgi:hypothetical protein
MSGDVAQIAGPGVETICGMLAGADRPTLRVRSSAGDEVRIQCPAAHAQRIEPADPDDAEDADLGLIASGECPLCPGQKLTSVDPDWAGCSCCGGQFATETIKVSPMAYHRNRAFAQL